MRLLPALALVLAACTYEHVEEQPDLTPSCGHFVGDACCFAPPSTLLCDPGLQCGAGRTCYAPDLAGRLDMSIVPRGPGAACQTDADCGAWTFKTIGDGGAYQLICYDAGPGYGYRCCSPESAGVYLCFAD